MARGGLVSLVAVLIVANKGVSYLREQSLARVFGAGSAFDAYAVAIAIAGIIFGLIGSALAAVAVPAIKAAETRGPAERAVTITTTLTITFWLLIGAAAAQMLLADPLVALVAPGLPATTSQTAVQLLVLLAPTTAMMGYWITAGGLLNAAEEFALPIYVPIFMDFTLLSVVLLLGGRIGVIAAAWGMLAGNIVQTLILNSALRRRGFSLTRGAFDAAQGRTLLKLASPVALAVLMSQSLQVLDKFYASSMSPGVISCLHYAILVTSIPIGVFGAAVSTVVFPAISGLYARRDMVRARSESNRAILASFTIGLMSLVALWTFASPVVRLLFGRGEFGSESVAVTADIVRYQSLMIPTLSASGVLERIYYATGRTLRPLLAVGGGLVAFVAAQLATAHLAPALPGHVRIGIGYAAYGLANLVLLLPGYLAPFVTSHDSEGR